MGNLVVSGAMITCTFGIAPSALVTIPKGPPVMAGGPPAGTIMDFAPFANVPNFGMCTTPSNPAVAAIIASSLGTVQQGPCVPVTTPWVPGSATVLINNFPALNDSSKCMCSWGGSISVTFAGQATVQVA